MICASKQSFLHRDSKFNAIKTYFYGLFEDFLIIFTLIKNSFSNQKTIFTFKSLIHVKRGMEIINNYSRMEKSIYHPIIIPKNVLRI